MPNLDKLTEGEIIDRLTNNIDNNIHNTIDGNIDYINNSPIQAKSKAFKKASVLIPFVRQDDEWHLLFIRRAESDKDQHSGQVAFVGGKAEGFDNSEIATALRETEEEIGVKPNDVNVLGRLGFHYSISNFEISPIVATIPWPYKLRPDPAEVSHTFTLPLNWLANEDNYEIKEWQRPGSNHKGTVVYFNKHEGELLWGATARMVLSLISALKQT